MSDELSISQTLKRKLKANDESRTDEFAEALLECAIKKNVTAMKMVVDLVEPPKQQEEPQRRMTDEELLEALDRLHDRIGSRRDQPTARA